MYIHSIIIFKFTFFFINIEGRDELLYMEFQLTNEHLDKINEIRSEMKNVLTSEGFKTPYDEINDRVWTKLAEFLHSPKMPLVRDDYWEGTYLKSIYNIDIAQYY